jgi:hypothetical protein
MVWKKWGRNSKAKRIGIRFFCDAHFKNNWTIQRKKIMPSEKFLNEYESIINELKNSVKTRLKFWEVDTFFRCPLVGMCLSSSEQKQLLKKTGLSGKRKSPYEIHEFFVASSENENRLSRRVDTFLYRKYGKEAAPLFELDHNEFIAHFKSAFQTGDYHSAFWAAAVNPQLPIELKREIFGEIHMAMHWNSDQRSIFKQKVLKQKKKINDLNQNIKEVNRQRRTLQKTNKNLQHELAELKAALSVMEKEKKELQTKNVIADTIPDHENLFQTTKFKEENKKLQIELKELWEQLNRGKQEVSVLEDRNLQLASDLKHQQEINDRIRIEIPKIIEELAAMNNCESTCVSFNLCKKRILMVGGITRMESLFRELIEGSGGIFDYHNGYIKKGVKQLESRLKRADVVLCPVSCNSHAACSIVKNLAKKHNKPVHMLANSSLNTLSQAILSGDKNKNIDSDGPPQFTQPFRTLSDGKRNTSLNV